MNHLKLVQLTRLLLAILVTGVIEARTGDPCPERCLCETKHVNCENANLRSLPRDLPDWTESLSMINNPLDSLSFEFHQKIISPQALRSIDFSHTQLRLVDTNYFFNLFTDINDIENSLQKLVFEENDLGSIPLLSNITNLRVLNVASNQLKCDTDLDLSLYYPELEVLDLSDNSINHISRHFLNSITSVPSTKLRTLNLNNNNIETIEHEAFQMFPNLEVLKLSKNRLSLISKEWLANLTHLKELDLNFNQITQIDTLAFNGLKMLQVLKMRRNKFNNLPDGAFWGLSSLQRLHLDHNNITNIRYGWTFGLSSLKELTIRHNSIATIESNSWNSASSLLELHLNHNQISQINKETFSKLTPLKVLKMSNNLVSFVDEFAFRSFTNLENLDLSNNRLSWAIEGSNGFFTTMRALKKLRLDNNEIRMILKRTFAGLASLSALNLTGNPISSIQNDSFSMFKHLKQLDLEDTDLLCDCTLKWFYRWLQSSELRRNFASQIQCKHPIEMYQRTEQSFLAADIDSFRCQDFLKPYLMDDFRNITTPLVAIKHKQITFNCTVATSSNSIEFKWFQNSKIIAHPRARFETKSKVYTENVTHHINQLTLTNIDDSDQGSYYCMASNQYGSVYSNKFDVNVYVVPFFVKRPVNISVQVGKNAKLECAAKGQPAPSISWQKDDGIMFPAAMERRMRVMPMDDVFFIVDVKESDTGWYTCNATNDATSVASKAYLDVYEPPTLVARMVDKKAIFNTTVSIECKCDGIPKPTITWYKNEELLQINKRHFFTSEKQILFIVRTDATDTGRYSCKVDNNYGTVEDSMRLTVISNSATDSSRLKNDDLYSSFITFIRKHFVLIIIIILCVLCTSIAWIIVIWYLRCRDNSVHQQNDYIDNREDYTKRLTCDGKATDSDSTSTKVCRLALESLNLIKLISLGYRNRRLQ